MSDTRTSHAGRGPVARPGWAGDAGDAALIWSLALTGFLIIAFAVACAGM